MCQRAKKQQPQQGSVVVCFVFGLGGSERLERLNQSGRHQMHRMPLNRTLRMTVIPLDDSMFGN